MRTQHKNIFKYLLKQNYIISKIPIVPGKTIKLNIISDEALA